MQAGRDARLRGLYGASCNDAVPHQPAPEPRTSAGKWSKAFSVSVFKSMLSRWSEPHSSLPPSQARTPLLALVDVDMLLGSRLYQDLRANPVFSQQIVKGANARAAYVLPAFETYGETHEAAALADLLASKDKRLLAESIRKQLAGPFDVKRFPQGHNWTLFDRWFVATDAYKVTYGHRWVPVGWILLLVSGACSPPEAPLTLFF